MAGNSTKRPQDKTKGDLNALPQNDIGDPSAKVHDAGGSDIKTGDQKVNPNQTTGGDPTRPADKSDNGDKGIVNASGSSNAGSGGSDESSKWKARLEAMCKDKKVVKEDLEALFKNSGLELSEDFIRQAIAVFESSVIQNVSDILSPIEEELKNEYKAEYESKLNSEVEKITEQVETYLDFAGKSWLEENQLALDQSLRHEIMEEFVGGLHKLFVEHNIDIPDDKLDVVEDLSTKLAEAKERLNAAEMQLLENKQALEAARRNEIIREISEDLADTQKEKFKQMVERIEYKDEKTYRRDLEVMRDVVASKSDVQVSENKDDEFESVDEHKNTSLNEDKNVDQDLNPYSKFFGSKKD